MWLSETNLTKSLKSRQKTVDWSFACLGSEPTHSLSSKQTTMPLAMCARFSHAQWEFVNHHKASILQLLLASYYTSSEIQGQIVGMRRRDLLPLALRGCYHVEESDKRLFAESLLHVILTNFWMASVILTACYSHNKANKTSKRFFYNLFRKITGKTTKLFTAAIYLLPCFVTKFSYKKISMPKIHLLKNKKIKHGQYHL